MSAIGKGDFVECIDASPDRITGEPFPLAVGAIFTVQAVAHFRDGRDGRESDGVDLVGVPRLRPNAWWRLERFKPVSGGQAGMFSHLLKRPADAPREPVAA